MFKHFYWFIWLAISADGRGQQSLKVSPEQPEPVYETVSSGVTRSCVSYPECFYFDASQSGNAKPQPPP